MSRRGYRKCLHCGRNRAERFFSSSRAKNCSTCIKRKRSKASHETRVTATYGLKPGEWDKLFESQEGRCAICGGSGSGNLDTDHDHTTGVVRGLLCRSDNRKVLKYSKNNPARLRAAARYLESPPAFDVIGFRYHSEDGEAGQIPEYWKGVPGYDGWYEVSSNGRVRSWRGLGSNASVEAPRRDEPLIMSQAETREGYLSVGLSKNGSVKNFRVNRLVLTTFKGDEPGLEACHNNGDRTDNRLANLRWDTTQSNSDDKYLHGTMHTGDKMPQSKLNADSVRELRRLWESDEVSVAELAMKFGVSKPTAWKAATGKTWKHVA